MKILYGVQATGNGHIARARALLPYLQKMGIQTDFIFSGAQSHTLFDMDCFGNARFFEGFTLAVCNGRLNKSETMKKSHPIRFWQDVRQLNVCEYDLVLTDFEPVSAWAAKCGKIPSLGLANQYALKYPIKNIKTPLGIKTALNFFAPANQYIGLHWQRFSPAIFPPLTENISRQDMQSGGFILVYLPAESLRNILSWLTRFSDTVFHVYAAVETPYQIDNVSVFPLSRGAFLHDIWHCDGVLCNSGFGVCTEALLAGKKILTRPLCGQFEQRVNAQLLQANQRAAIIKHFCVQQMKEWLATDGFLPIQFPNVAEAIVEWIGAGRQETIEFLSAQLWQEVQTINVKQNYFQAA